MVTEDRLRRFLQQEQSRFSVLSIFFRTHQSDRKYADVLSATLASLNGGVLLMREGGIGYSIRQTSREDFRELLVAEGALPQHEHFFRGLADRFVRLPL
jgi:hypothetical protein